MSAPIVLSSIPNSNDVDIVLGAPIQIVFDQPIDPATITTATFALTGPGTTQIVDSEQLQMGQSILSGREYITGTFSYTDSSTLIFTPGRPLRPGVIYSVIIVGGDSMLVTSCVKNLAGEKLATSYQFLFTTGTLNILQPPVSSPLSWETTQNHWDRPKLDFNSILVKPHKAQGNDLTQVIELTFPSPIDPLSFNIQDILVSIEPFLNDPLVSVPDGLSATIDISGNKLFISISGWS